MGIIKAVRKKKRVQVRIIGKFSYHETIIWMTKNSIKSWRDDPFIEIDVVTRKRNTEEGKEIV